MVAGILVVLFVPLVLLFIGFAVRRFQPSRRPNPRLGMDALAANVPTFKIVALGLQGSGKTLLLSSMYQQLLMPTPSRSYYLVTSHEDSARLREQFCIMADSSRPDGWPEGTTQSQTRHYKFSVQTQTAGDPLEVLRLDYLEYPGELLTDTRPASAEAQQRFHQDVKAADALICILDGQVILEQRRETSGRWSGLDNALSVLVENLRASRGPITFVITKWDLFGGDVDDDQTKLQEVSDLLMSNDQFRQLLILKGGRRIVRLIPASAVGTGFARLDASGRVVKIANRPAQPTNVDVPLSAVVPDVFAQAEATLRAELRAQLAAEYAAHLRIPPWQRLYTVLDLASRPATGAVLQAFGGNIGAAVGGTTVELLLSRRAEPFQAWQAEVQRELSDAERREAAFAEARTRVIKDMQDRVDEIETRLPASLLTPHPG
ncbi:hypothetical protein ACH35V_15150 [Actinomadura sp. 1N219]|uniref:TRAFAC clade GTPase domain-containing protein n=1 Tax=Actinomadura sp. 1N219 TaxID=3375152 RepID=UPI00378740A6